MILGLSGFAGVGKDTVADALCQHHNFAKISLADPLKRVCQDVFGFTDEQLWGPSDLRGKVDVRYPRAHSFDRDGRCTCCGTSVGDAHRGLECYLTPRYALQLLGTEWGRRCYPDVWVDCVVREARSERHANKNVVIPDVRFKNEVSGLRKHGVLLVRLKRPGFEAPAYDHPSETEQLQIPDSDFDYVFQGGETLDGLDDRVRDMVYALTR